MDIFRIGYIELVFDLEYQIYKNSCTSISSFYLLLPLSYYQISTKMHTVGTEALGILHIELELVDKLCIAFSFRNITVLG